MPGGSPNKWIGVAEDIRERIISGEFPDGTPLPIGPELCREYEIGRSTLEKVRVFLREEGLIRTGQSVRPEPCVTSHCTPDRCIVTYKKENV
nr:GntR family transcriptional regulator [Streptomyces coelicoflavus]